VLLADAETALQAVTAPDFPADWNAISKVLDVATERFSRAWGAVGHLNAVADTPELRAAYNEAMPRVTAFWTRLGSDERLYAKYKAIDVATLNAEQRRRIATPCATSCWAAPNCRATPRKRFAAIQERQAELSQKFSENALDATDAFAYYAELGELDGVPEDVVSAARAPPKPKARKATSSRSRCPATCR
jgi:oligopeptidase A